MEWSGIMRRRRHSHRRGKNHTVRNIVISCFVITLFLATGYSAFQTNINLNIKGNIKEKSRIMRSWNNYIIGTGSYSWSSNTPDFHNDEYREKIIKITFLSSADVPNNAIKSWDVSEDGKGGVMAYITLNEEDSSKYNLYIGAKEGVIGNENSSWLFFDFQNLTNITFNNNFDTSHVKNFSIMFYKDYRLKEIDVSSFNTENATTLNSLFHDCTSLEKINGLNSFNTKNVNDFGFMFKLNKISEIDVSNFDTSNVVSTSHMFSDCTNLITLNLSNFDTKNTFRTDGMFENCTNLKTIYTSDKFVTTNVYNSTNMFFNDTNLLGGNGTAFDSTKLDKEYARIDTASTPGYFTLKQ